MKKFIICLFLIFSFSSTVYADIRVTDVEAKIQALNPRIVQFNGKYYIAIDELPTNCVIQTKYQTNDNYTFKTNNSGDFEQTIITDEHQGMLRILEIEWDLSNNDALYSKGAETVIEVEIEDIMSNNNIDNQDISDSQEFNGSEALGWVQDGNDWYYNDGSGEWVTGEQEINGKTYFFREDGRMWADTFIDTVPMKYVDASGAMVTNSWIYKGVDWYYFDENGDGVRDQTIEINNKYYAFDRAGRMRTYGQTEEGYNIGSDGVVQVED